MKEKLETILKLTLEMKNILSLKPNKESVTYYHTDSEMLSIISQLTFFAFELQQEDLHRKEKEVLYLLAVVISRFWGAQFHNSQLYFMFFQLEELLLEVLERTTLPFRF